MKKILFSLLLLAAFLLIVGCAQEPVDDSAVPEELQEEVAAVAGKAVETKKPYDADKIDLCRTDEQNCWVPFLDCYNDEQACGDLYKAGEMEKWGVCTDLCSDKALKLSGLLPPESSAGGASGGSGSSEEPTTEAEEEEPAVSTEFLATNHVKCNLLGNEEVTSHNGNSFCKSKGEEFCSAGYLILENGLGPDITLPVDCLQKFDQDDLNEIGAENEKYASVEIDDMVTAYSCCSLIDEPAK